MQHQDNIRKDVSDKKSQMILHYTEMVKHPELEAVSINPLTVLSFL